MSLEQRLTLILLTAAASACGGGAPADSASAAADRGTAVDSVLPMDVAFQRFRAGLPRPESLRSPIRDRDTLVARLIRALEQGDTTAFEAMALDRAEFAWLYYPTAKVAKPPYELPPGIAWMQLREGGRKGVVRALRELGGRPLDFRGYRCDPESEAEGENRLWTGCVVTVSPRGMRPAPLRLFGKILERDGRFEVISYANDF